MKIKTAAIQMHTVPDKMENIRTAGAYIEKVSAQKPDFVILPEMFCCPYQTENFPVYAEEEFLTLPIYLTDRENRSGNIGKPIFSISM